MLLGVAIDRLHNGFMSLAPRGRTTSKLKAGPCHRDAFGLLLAGDGHLREAWRPEVRQPTPGHPADSEEDQANDEKPYPEDE